MFQKDQSGDNAQDAEHRRRPFFEIHRSLPPFAFIERRRGNPLM
jgi:hypothetical protein